MVRSTFASEKAKNTSRSEHFWKLRCRKSARRCGAKHISKSNQKCKKLKGTGLFWTFRCRFAWQAQGIAHVVKSEQKARVCSISNKDGRRGRFKEDLQRCTFHLAGAMQKTCSSELLGGPGADFLRWVPFWSI